MASARTVTLLFTDLVDSTELIQRAGDEHAQRVFRAHHRVLRQAVDQHGGHEVKWLGDGLMVAFPSVADALRCAVRMQQVSHRPTAGERLQIRVGLNVGEALRDETDYFGTPVVVARRLCDAAQAGQIIASEVVTQLLRGGKEFAFRPLGELELKGIAQPVPAVEVAYEYDPLALLGRTPFVGRKDELAALEQALATVRGGRGAVILLAGEPGIGKTRLAEEFCDKARGVGSTIVRGGCDEGDIAAPYRLWVEALRGYTRARPDNDLRRELGPGAPEVATLLPELRQRLPNIEVAPRLDPEAERLRLFDSLTQFVRNASASEGALVVFLDDLHWADMPSLLLLRHVARHAANDRLLLVGAYRDVELDRGHPLAQALAELLRLEQVRRLHLGGLAEESVEELLAAIELSEELAEARQGLAQVLHEQTEGNPFFLREVLSHLVETGKIVREGGRWVGTVTSAAELLIPEGVREVIGQRLFRLSEGCNRMLTRASAMTGAFTWEELKAVCEEPEEQLLNLLDEAIAAHLIAELPGQTAVYAFTHTLIRHTLYEELAGPRRVLLHRQIGQALERLHLEPHLAELAHHFLRAAPGSPEHIEKAVEYATRAGERAMALFAWEEAAQHYDRALQALELAVAPSDAQRCHLLLRLAEAQKNAAHVEAALRIYRRAVAAARALGDAELLVRAAVGFESAADSVFGDITLRQEALELLDQALRTLGEEDSRPRVRALSARIRPAAALSGGGQDLFSSGGFGAWAGRKDRALVAQAREAAAMAERLGDPSLLWFALDTLRNYSYGPGNAPERLAMSNQILLLARQAQSSAREAYARFHRLVDLLELGDLPAVRDELTEYTRLSHETWEGNTGWNALATAAMLATAEGRLVEAERLVFEALARGQLIRQPNAATAFGGQIYALRWLQGRLGELEASFRDAVRRSPNVRVYQAGLILIYCELAKIEEARLEFERLTVHSLADIPEDFLSMATMSIASEISARLNDTTRAQFLYSLLLPHDALTVSIANVVTQGITSRNLGQLATVLERWGDAERHFQHAIEMNARMGFAPWVAMTQLNYAQMLVARDGIGDREQAAGLLGEGLAAAERMGMAKVASDCTRLLRG